MRPGLAPGEHSPGDAMHSIRELGAFGLALSVGMLVVVWQPHRASGLLPMAMALAAGLALTAGADIVSGRSGLLDEAPHLLEVGGVLLLWRLARTTAASPPSASASTSMPAAAA